jgi:hypothetical protein
MRMWSWCGKEMSPTNRPRPVTRGGSSMRVTGSPMILVFTRSIQAFLISAAAARTAVRIF